MSEADAHDAIGCLMYEGRLAYNSLTPVELFEEYMNSDGTISAVDTLAAIERAVNL